MKNATSRPWYKAGSTWIATLMVAAAGVVAWFGSASSGHTASQGTAVTVAGTPGADARVAVDPLSLGGLPTRIVVSSAGIDTPIAEVGVIDQNGVPAWETAWKAAGHHLDSALPGQPGNVVITGHVSVADRRNAAVFARLDHVAPGDVVDLYSGDTVYHYRVDHVTVVAPDQVGVLRSNHSSTVTLITCTSDLKKRLVVTGTLA